VSSPRQTITRDIDSGLGRLSGRTGRSVGGAGAATISHVCPIHIHVDRLIIAVNVGGRWRRCSFSFHFSFSFPILVPVPVPVHCPIPACGDARRTGWSVAVDGGQQCVGRCHRRRHSSNKLHRMRLMVRLAVGLVVHWGRSVVRRVRLVVRRRRWRCLAVVVPGIRFRHRRCVEDGRRRGLSPERGVAQLPL